MPSRRTSYVAGDTPIVRKKRQKYGTKCFERWGRKGGSPILKRYMELKQQRARRSR